MDVHRQTGREYILRYNGNQDDKPKDIYWGRRLSKLAKRLVNDLPSLETAFMIESREGTWSYSEPKHFTVYSPPTSRELRKINNIADREIRKRKEGWKGVARHYGDRLTSLLEALQEYFTLGINDDLFNPPQERHPEDEFGPIVIKNRKNDHFVS